ncbi:MAG: Fic family protein [Leptospira sp.]|nr:Fic family protein [Leptospira sp.]
MYIHERKDFPNFKWDEKVVLRRLVQVRGPQGKLLGRMESLGFSLQLEATLLQETENVFKTSRIEGENLNQELIRSSVSKQLGMPILDLKFDKDIDSIVAMMMDATENYQENLTKDRLLNWHKLLFPDSYSGLKKIRVGKWRSVQSGPMQVVSGRLGKEIIHFEAPIANRIPNLIKEFLQFCNGSELDPVLIAGISQLWFLTIHPFEDGNGRIARVISDLFLARTEGTGKRFYSHASTIEKRRKEYYSILENTQKGNMDITDWLLWFLDTLEEAIQTSEIIIQKVLRKDRLFSPSSESPESESNFNPRQKKMILKLIDGWDGKLTTSKWASACNCSQDTAGRDIQDLIQKGILVQSAEGGRSRHYILR